MTLARLFGTLLLVMAMGMVLVLFRAEETRVGRRLEETRRLRGMIRVQYERIMCEKSACTTPRFVEERTIEMGLELTWPSGSTSTVLADAEG